MDDWPPPYDEYENEPNPYDDPVRQNHEKVQNSLKNYENLSKNVKIRLKKVPTYCVLKAVAPCQNPIEKSTNVPCFKGRCTVAPFDLI